jgi:predicted lipoprotein with Yx(FWY)xxD motif
MTASHHSTPHTESTAAASRSIVATFVIALAVTAVLGASAAGAQAIAERNGNLANAEGRTLYTYDKDAAGVSNCSGGCAFEWPPFLAKDGATDNGAFTVITRADGRKQWARDGKPLYFYVGDLQAGNVRGDNHGGTWHVVKTDGKQAGKTDAKQASGSGSTSTGYGSSSYDSGYSYKP